MESVHKTRYSSLSVRWRDKRDFAYVIKVSNQSTWRGRSSKWTWSNHRSHFHLDPEVRDPKQEKVWWAITGLMVKGAMCQGMREASGSWELCPIDSQQENENLNPSITGMEFCLRQEWAWKQIFPKSLQIRTRPGWHFNSALGGPKPRNQPQVPNFVSAELQVKKWVLF